MKMGPVRGVSAKPTGQKEESVPFTRGSRERSCLRGPSARVERERAEDASPVEESIRRLDSRREVGTAVERREISAESMKKGRSRSTHVQVYVHDVPAAAPGQLRNLIR